MHATLSLNDASNRTATMGPIASFPMGIGPTTSRGPTLPSMLSPRGIDHSHAFSAFDLKPPALSTLHSAWRTPLRAISPPYATATHSKSVLASSAPFFGARAPTLPSIHSLVNASQPEGCTHPPHAKPFFKTPPMKRVPPGAMVTTGSRWLEDPEPHRAVLGRPVNLSWYILPAPTWPTRTGMERGIGSAPHQEGHLAGALPSEAAEQARPRLMSISALLHAEPPALDATSPTTDSSSPSLFSSPLSSAPSTPDFERRLPLVEHPSSSLASTCSSDDEPLGVMPRTKVQLPGIATLNLPKPPTKGVMAHPRAATRPVAGRRPTPVVNSESDSEGARARFATQHSTSSSSSPLSSPDMEIDELADDDDEYLPPSASSSKRKSPPVSHDERPPKKKGPGPPATRRHQCDECPQVFYYDSHYNKHKVLHAKKKGKNAKPFSCARCNQGFGRIWDLERHLFTHTGKKPFQCNYCTRGYNRRDALLRHLRQGKPGHPKPRPKTR